MRMVKKVHNDPTSQHCPVDVLQEICTTARQTPEQFVRLNQFIALMGWSRSTYYNRVSAGIVPAARANGPRTRGYFASEVVAMQQALMIDPSRAQGHTKPT
ncbi:helix-turn-helix transcriptional regulator [Variovorax atrisoli]|uniref:helix-turn-helix transcriptional regulator n=1 Tax=Variovorax atrisoli TaxID=3394203 RepID=UPI001427E95F|nr:hypothetical protein [Variovorax paradoxus]